MPRPVALVSVAEARQDDTDLPHLVRALADRGVTAEIIDWDTAAADWERFEAAVIRSTWDYHRRLPEFLAWIDSVSAVVPVLNPPAMLRWNTDKTYLRELVDAGLPVIPTTFIASTGDLVRADDLLRGDVVVKPTVSAGSNNTERHAGDPASATAHVGALVDTGSVVMVQPYQRFIDDNGETGLVYIDGAFSHAFRKQAILSGGTNRWTNGLYADEDISARRANEQELELGERVIEWVTGRFGATPLYARVDMVRGTAGSPVLMELELTEPSLYLHLDAASPARFASAVVARRSVGWAP